MRAAVVDRRLEAVAGPVQLVNAISGVSAVVSALFVGVRVVTAEPQVILRNVSYSKPRFDVYMAANTGGLVYGKDSLTPVVSRQESGLLIVGSRYLDPQNTLLIGMNATGNAQWTSPLRCACYDQILTVAQMTAVAQWIALYQFGVRISP